MNRIIFSSIVLSLLLAFELRIFPSYHSSEDYTVMITPKEGVVISDNSGEEVKTIAIDEIIKDDYNATNIIIDKVYFLDTKRIIIKALDRTESGYISIFYLYDIENDAEITSIPGVPDLSYYSYSNYDMRYISKDYCLMIAKSGDGEYIPAKALLIGYYEWVDDIKGEVFDENQGITLKSIILPRKSSGFANYNQYTGYVDVYAFGGGFYSYFYYYGSEEIEELRSADISAFAKNYIMDDDYEIIEPIDESSDWEAGGEFYNAGGKYYVPPLHITANDNYIIATYKGVDVTITNRKTGEVTELVVADFQLDDKTMKEGDECYFLSEDIVVIPISPEDYSDEPVNIIYDLKNKQPLSEIDGIDINLLVNGGYDARGMAEGCLFFASYRIYDGMNDVYYLYHDGEKVTVATIDASYGLWLPRVRVSQNGRYLAALTVYNDKYSIFHEEGGELRFVRSEIIPAEEVEFPTDYVISDSGEIIELDETTHWLPRLYADLRDS